MARARRGGRRFGARARGGRCGAYVLRARGAEGEPVPRDLQGLRGQPPAACEDS